MPSGESIFQEIEGLVPSGGTAISPPHPSTAGQPAENADVMDSWEHLRRVFTGRLANNLLRAQNATRRLRTAVR